MESPQAKGYLFEYIIQDLLKKSGYVSVKTAKIKGRGGNHQIDAYGSLLIPTPFIYPIRLICEAKNYNKNIGLGKIRDFVGVMKDISENYIVRKNSKFERFTDSGCYFSRKGFAIDAQKYAWAQNIFLVSYNGIDQLGQIETILDKFINLNPIRDLSKDNLLNKFKLYFKENVKNLDISFIVGIINKVYPVVIVGKKSLNNKIKRGLPERSDILDATKSSRQEGEFDTVFNLNILNSENISVSVPNFIAKKIIDKIDSSKPGKKIFSVDIPVLSKIKRFVTINVFLPEEEKINYLNGLDNINTED